MTLRTRLLTVASLLLIAGAGTCLWLAHEPVEHADLLPVPVSRDKTVRDGAAGMQAQVEVLRTRVETLQSELAELRTAADASKRESVIQGDEALPVQQVYVVDSVAEEDEVIDYDSYTAEYREQVLVDHLDEILATDDDDTAWSSNVEMEVEDVLALEEMEGSHLLDVRCRLNLCRVHLTHDNGKSQLAAAENIPITPPFNTDGMIRFIGDDENPETLVYVARQGERLPEIID